MLLYDTAFKFFRFGDASVMAVFVFVTPDAGDAAAMAALPKTGRVLKPPVTMHCFRYGARHEFHRFGERTARPREARSQASPRPLARYPRGCLRRHRCLLPFFLDGRHVAENRSGNPAHAAADRAGPVAQPGQLRRSLQARTLPALPAEQRHRRLRLRREQRGGLVAGRLRICQVSIPRTRRLLPRGRRHPDGSLPIGRRAALRLDERSRTARHLHGHRGAGPRQRLRRLPDAAGHRDDTQRLHRRGPHRRLQRAADLLLGRSCRR